MVEKMTPTEKLIAEARELDRMATPGPWVQSGGGYDDANFHQHVIPMMRCEKCGKTGAECGADYRPLTTKYPEGYQI